MAAYFLTKIYMAIHFYANKKQVSQKAYFEKYELIISIKSPRK